MKTDYQRAKAAKWRRDWRKRHPERHAAQLRVHNLRNRFGLTPEQYDEMVDRQGGNCALCGKPETALTRAGEVRRLAVDHDHDTLKVRGLLCTGCNCGLGNFKDDPALLLAAAEYLERT